MLRRKVYHVQVRTDLCWGGGLEGGHNISLIKTVQMFELNPPFFAVLLSHKSAFRQPDLKKKKKTGQNSKAEQLGIVRAFYQREQCDWSWGRQSGRVNKNQHSNDMKSF